MFIAVINENFDVAEEHKRSRQASHFFATQRPQKAQAPWVRRLNPYRWFQARPKAIAVDQLPSNLVLPMQKSLVQDYTFSRADLGSSSSVWFFFSDSCRSDSCDRERIDVEENVVDRRNEDGRAEARVAEVAELVAELVLG